MKTGDSESMKMLERKQQRGEECVVGLESGGGGRERGLSDGWMCWLVVGVVFCFLSKRFRLLVRVLCFCHVLCVVSQIPLCLFLLSVF